MMRLFTHAMKQIMLYHSAVEFNITPVAVTRLAMTVASPA